ncbi:hypothetical protein [Paenibacillus beijingensis]|uniref:Uncharacterized protein n=1 Tax=Paenibacillus beijingensis TaxID=1126833 RepID=A0A0D5NEK5_9BACL|nr:hypothetical protein [Paenibacillus beijingensis]AJY73651.1 hypothetical protein VN24_02175 [Paenibacillus beijingensis]
MLDAQGEDAIDCERLCGKSCAEFHSGAGLLNGGAGAVTGSRNGSVGRHGFAVRYPFKGVCREQD